MSGKRRSRGAKDLYLLNQQLTQEDKAVYVRDPLRYYIFSFKTKRCRLKNHQHHEPSCPYFKYPEGRRRNPIEYEYAWRPCTNVNETGGQDVKFWGDPSKCPLKDKCPQAHNTYESWFHPERFKTYYCKRWQYADCKYGLGCARAHGDEELRDVEEAEEHLKRAREIYRQKRGKQKNTAPIKSSRQPVSSTSHQPKTVYASGPLIKPKSKTKAAKKTKSKATAIWMRGLPWNASKADIKTFFDKLKLLNIHLTKTETGRASGEAYVEFLSESQVTKGLKLDGKFMEHRYVELYRCSVKELEKHGITETKRPVTGGVPVKRVPGASSKAPRKLRQIAGNPQIPAHVHQAQHVNPVPSKQNSHPGFVPGANQSVESQIMTLKNRISHTRQMNAQLHIAWERRKEDAARKLEMEDKSSNESLRRSIVVLRNSCADWEERMACCVCRARDKHVVLVPCGHCICHSELCRGTSNQCKTCGKSVASYYRIYW